MTHDEFIDQYLQKTEWHIRNDILYVDSYLNLCNSNIKYLPNKLVIDGSLDLRNSKIMSLPKELYVNKNLLLWKTIITELPNNLTIGNGLWMDGEPIMELSNNLSVGDVLCLIKTKITSLPDTLSFTGAIYSDNKLEMSEKIQLNIISNRKHNFLYIKNPTEKAKTLQKLLWEL